MSKVFKYVKEVFRGRASVDLCGHKFKSRGPMRVVFKFEDELLKRVVKPAVSEIFDSKGEKVIEVEFSLREELRDALVLNRSLAKRLEYLCGELRELREDDHNYRELSANAADRFLPIIKALKGRGHCSAWYNIGKDRSEDPEEAPMQYRTEVKYF